MARRFDVVRRDAERRLVGAVETDDGRRGIGTVYAFGELRFAGDTLSAWRWRRGDPDHHPGRLGARLFVDDPLGAAHDELLATRSEKAHAFAAAANAFFDYGDARFAARSLEVVEADADRPVGIHAGHDADVLAIDLMRGLSNARIVDRLVEERHGGDPGRVTGMLFNPSGYVEVWHRLERLDAVRAMLDPSLPRLRLPSLPAMRRRVSVVADGIARRRGRSAAT